ncbi:AraC family transcriptional regulator [Paenibacillus sp. H1-7]|nr:AraC family transcriptional regulator [Paenibacillus sp. H1-7]
MSAENRLNETAQRVGYRDTSYFCSAFKQLEGVPPLEFRRSGQ